jgi:hypothetical protein
MDCLQWSGKANKTQKERRATEELAMRKGAVDSLTGKLGLPGVSGRCGNARTHRVRRGLLGLIPEFRNRAIVPPRRVGSASYLL